MAIADRPWQRALLLRGGLAGVGLAVVGVAGARVVLDTAAAPGDLAILLATALMALAVGVWAGAPDSADATLPLRDRWLSAAAATAVAGAYGTFSALYQTFYPGPVWRVAGSLIAVAIPSYALGLLLPLLVAWGFRQIEQEEEEVAPWVAVGSVVVAVLAGAVAGILLASHALLPFLNPGSLLMTMAIALLLPLVLPDPDEAAPRETVLFETASPFGSLRVSEVAYPGERQPERRLYLNDEEESGELVRSGAPTLAYVSAAEHWLARTTPPGARYLFLGGGAYTLPRRIAERDREARLLVVELDPEVTRIAYRFFGLNPHHPIDSVHGDARAYLEADLEPTFDRIYVDVYAGREALPYSLVTVEAAARMERRLERDGVVALNLIGSLAGAGARQVWSIVRTFDAVFPNVALYTHLGRDYPDRQNLLLIAARGNELAMPADAGVFDLWPREQWPTASGTVVFHDLLPGREAGRDAGRDAGELAPRSISQPAARPRERRA
jgi:spermidine synthase